MAFGFLERMTEALWLLTILSAVENSEFAKFKCQKEVSVCKDDQAEMICSSTKDFDGIKLYFPNGKADEQLLFSMTTVGESPHQHGMYLKFKIREATLVIPNTQFSHRGTYRWLLSGRGSSNEHTTLHVSDAPTISKENGSLICRAQLVKAGRRIIWSNDLPTELTEVTSNLDATGLVNLSSSQLWKASFSSNPPCCKVVDEKGFQELCAKTCYNSAIMDEISGTPTTDQNNTQQPIIAIILIPVLILALIVIYRCLKKRQSSTIPTSTTLL
ncbi:uncharacterized protein LOC118845591 [Trichosurus vulpecula]|uniref:uncharacterized protein LOC118845591 n=1 Tax=Trichosurus vulpecula TaxID=9337 RepID=UPI00186B3D8F|nr:uncharacterized protein LOC118845591 [Trichosurus vulpecula]